MCETNGGRDVLTRRADLTERRKGQWCHPIFFFLLFVICFVALSPCRLHHRGDINADTNKHPLSHETVQVCVKCVPFSSRFHEVCIKMRYVFFFSFWHKQSIFLSFIHTHTNCSNADMLLMLERSQLAREPSRSIVLI